MTKPRILMLHRQRSAVGYYRSWAPLRLLRRLGYQAFGLEGQSYRALQPQNRKLPREEWWRQWLRENLGNFDILHIDREVSHEMNGVWGWFRHYSPGCRMIVDFDDDFTDVPDWNKAKAKCHPGQEMYEAGLNHLRIAELTTVSTPTLEEKFRPLSHAIRTVLNRIDPADWTDLPVCPDRASDPYLRVFYGGADGHFGDLDAARAGLTYLLQNPPVPFRLICLGAVPFWMHDIRRKHPERVVSLPWVPFEDYPAAVAWGGFDLAIAPLAPHPFNEAKSNIKWLEAAVQGIPFLASRVGPYASIPDGCAIRVENTPGDWKDGITAMLEDQSLRVRTADLAREAVMDEWVIDRGAWDWQNVIETALSRPRIETAEDTRLPGQSPDLTAPEAPSAPGEGPAPAP